VKHDQPPAEPAPTFEDLYAGHRERVLRLLRAFGVLSEHDRKDASQEVWIDVHRALSQFDPRRGTARAWIGGIAHNAARDHRRTLGRRPEGSPRTDEEPSTTRTAETEAADAEQREALWSFYERAVPNQEQRVAFLLHVIEGMTVEEVAQTTSAQPCTVRWRIAMARHKLKEKLTEEERRKLLAILPVISVDAFVHAMRETKFPEGESAKTWERITKRIEAEGGSIHDRLGAPERAPSPGLSKGYTFTGARLVSAAAAVFLLGALSGAAAVYALLSSPSNAHMRMIEAEIPPPPLPTSAPPPEPSPTASTTPSVTSSPAAPSSTWQSETWVLNRARTAEPAEALALTDQHAQRFPTSRRAAAREEIAIGALVKLGRQEEAEKRAARLLQWAPEKRPAIEALLGRTLF